jgi:alpha-tubulin suppressor-like RCC1 family protein
MRTKILGVVGVALWVFLSPLASIPVAAAGTTSDPVYVWGKVGAESARTYDLSPTAITGVPGTVAQVASTNGNVYVRTTGGHVWAVGNWEGLGDGATSSTQSTTTNAVRVQIPTTTTIATLPETGPEGTEVAIDTNGNVWGWGLDNYAQLCLGSAGYVPKPVEVPISHVVLTAGAGDHEIYVTSSGSVYECGADNHGDLGNGALSAASDTPELVKGLPSGLFVANVVASWSNTGILYTNGSYYDWGYNAFGDVGNGQTTDASLPVLAEQNVADVSEGGGGPIDGQTLALLTNGTVVGWGSDNAGQLCNGVAENDVLTPTAITPPTPWSSVYSGGDTSYALTSTGALWDCGNDQYGQLGIGVVAPYKLHPKNPLNGVSETSSTQFRSVAWVP